MPSFQQIKLLEVSPDLVRDHHWKNQRLGKLVEEFIIHDLQQADGISWVTESLQIQAKKRTLGELDALYYDHGVPIHLEIAYKFYLYDTLNIPADPLAYWIGPNRKDTLLLKLDKIRQRQLPLLHHPNTRHFLKPYGLAAGDIVQKLCFRGQLFLPYRNQNLDVSPLNPDCVFGFHLPFREFAELEALEFYLPEKLDWLITPHPRVEWISYRRAAALIRLEIEEERSPMAWVKSADGSLGKCFVTFW
ncbi:DUF1853 family protein [Lewinella sp. W8]|uniref:DUF1853 family protein n=1 Tax=Lewinella sp. W8 TaxID=2528208 RepID=UPI0020A62CBA|nr:DUF1853 family protein [Lewinella sp. W8]